MKILSEEERKSEEHGRVERTDDRGAEEGRGRQEDRAEGKEGRSSGGRAQVESGLRAPQDEPTMGPQRHTPQWQCRPSHVLPRPHLRLFLLQNGEIIPTPWGCWSIKGGKCLSITWHT